MAAEIRFKKFELKSKHGTILVNPELSLMANLLEAGLPVASSCRGDGVCGKCRLYVTSLEPDATSSIGALEKILLAKANATEHERISCQTKVQGPVEVDADYW